MRKKNLHLILLPWTLSHATAQPEPCSIRHHTGKGHPKPFSLVESLLQQKWAQGDLHQAMAPGGMSGSSREDAVGARERMKELLEEELLYMRKKWQQSKQLPF